MRLSRLLEATLMLVNRRSITAPFLAEHFGVSVRTIYRDFTAIEAAGIPVERYQGSGGGFRIPDNYRLTRQILTFDDIVSIITALRGINRALNNRELFSIIEKIECLVPEDREKEYQLLSEQVAFDITPWGYSGCEASALEMLHAAITERQVLSFVYTDNIGKETSRQIEPMTLVFKSNAWYLFGFCCIRQDYRLFKLSRMISIEQSGNHFIRRQASWRDAAAADPAVKKPLRLTLELTRNARNKLTEFIRNSKVDELQGGIFRVTLDLDDEEWIVPWLLSFGAEVEVISPASLRKRIAEQVSALQKKYLI